MYRIYFKNRWNQETEVFTFKNRQNVEVFDSLTGSSTVVLPAKTMFLRYPGVEIIEVSTEIACLLNAWLKGAEYIEYSCYNGLGIVKKIDY